MSQHFILNTFEDYAQPTLLYLLNKLSYGMNKIFSVMK